MQGFPACKVRWAFSHRTVPRKHSFPFVFPQRLTSQNRAVVKRQLSVGRVVCVCAGPEGRLMGAMRRVFPNSGFCSNRFSLNAHASPRPGVVFANFAWGWLGLWLLQRSIPILVLRGILVDRRFRWFNLEDAWGIRSTATHRFPTSSFPSDDRALFFHHLYRRFEA